MSQTFVILTLLLTMSVAVNLCLWDLYRREKESKLRAWAELRKERERGWR